MPPPTSPNIQMTGMNTSTSTRPTSSPTILERKISEAAIFKRTRTRGSKGGRTQTTLLGNSRCSSSNTSSSGSLLSQFPLQWLVWQLHIAIQDGRAQSQTWGHLQTSSGVVQSSEINLQGGFFVQEESKVEKAGFLSEQLGPTGTPSQKSLAGQNHLSCTW